LYVGMKYWIQLTVVHSYEGNGYSLQLSVSI